MRSGSKGGSLARARLFPSWTLAGAILLLLASSASSGQLAIEPDSIDWKQMRSVADFMRVFGQPDSFAERQGTRVYSWKRTVTMGFSDDDGVESREKFECEMTAKFAGSGPVLEVRSDVANVGALAIASAGGFGPGCARTFGMKNSRRAVAAERMKR